MKYYVYKLTNQHSDIIYIGQTNNLSRRFKQHQTGLRKAKLYYKKCNEVRGKKLYKDCISNNWRINSITLLKTVEHRSIAKLWESTYILNELLHNNNMKLTNAQLDKTRIYKHLI